MARTYFLRFFDNSGNVLTGGGGVEWLLASNVRFSTENFAAHAMPGTLHVSFAPDPTTTTLLDSMLNNVTLDHVEIESYDTDAATPNVAFDEYLFGQAVIASFTISRDAEPRQQLDLTWLEYQHSQEIIDAEGHASGLLQSAWDFVGRNFTDPLPTQTEAAASVIGASSGQVLDTFVRLRNDSGVITGDNGAEWLKLRDFNFGVSLSPGAAVAAGALSLGFAAEARAAWLDSILVSASPISVEIESYATGPSGPVLVEEYLFDSVFVNSSIVTADPASGRAYEMVFGAFQASTIGYDADGKALTPVQTAWDFVTSTPTPPAPVKIDAMADGATSSDGQLDLKYFVRLFDHAGQPIGTDGGGQWLLLSSLSFGLASEATAGGSEPRAGALTLRFGTDGAATTLADMLTTETSLDRVEVESYAFSGGDWRMVDEYLFDSATVTGVTIGGTGAGSLNRVDLSYAAYQAAHLDPGAAGAPVVDSVVTWDFSSKKAPPETPVTADWANATHGGDARPVTYVARFFDHAGNVITGDAGVQWLLTSDVGFSLDLSPGAAPRASTLTFNVGPDQITTKLFAAMLDQQTLDRVEIETYLVSSPSTLVDEYLFNDAFLTTTTIARDDDPHGRVELAFGSYQQSHADKGVSRTAWDFTQDKSLPLVALKADLGSMATGGAPQTGLEYYARLVGDDGQPLAGPDDVQWFRLDNFGFGVSVDAGSGAGSETAAALTIDFASDVRSTLLDKKMIEQKHLQGVEIETYQTLSGGARTMLEEYLFSDVAITGTTTSIDGGRHAALHYSNVQVSALDETGAVAQSAWDFVSHTAPDLVAAKTGALAAGGLTASADGPLTYYARFFDKSGDQIVGDTGAWLTLSDMSFSLSALLGGGGISNKATPSLLTLSFASTSTAVLLNSRLVIGQSLERVEIEAYANGAGVPRMTDEYLFGVPVIVDLEVDDSAPAVNHLSFEYFRYQESHLTSGAGGVETLAAQAAWSNNPIAPPLIPPIADRFAVACYCEGTHIATPTGLIPIERLRVGKRHLDLTRHPTPRDAQPISILADAIADGVPRARLRLSPDHALLLDGLLVPAKLLVNGATICREDACRDVVYYHIELETHDLLLAENTPAESWLDTGNGGMFDDLGAKLTRPSEFASEQRRREMESCAPFAADASLVEPIWRGLAERASRMGHTAGGAVAPTSHPGPCVILGGRRLMPVRAGDCYMFALPATDGPARLVSDAAAPADLRPWVDDRRRLGIAVRGLTLHEGGIARAVPLDHPGLTEGWWDVEQDAGGLWRWTDGDAVLPLPRDGAAMLEVRLAPSPVPGAALVSHADRVVHA